MMRGAPATERTSADRQALVTRFVHELEAVSGRATYAASLAEAAGSIAAQARAASVRSAAVGQGVATDLAIVADALEGAGITVTRTGPVDEIERPRIRERIARCDLGVAEADYGVAASGTLAVFANPGRPGSLTLLPPISVVILRRERIVPDLAALFKELGPAAIAANRLTLITGPSRTADIEKMIVLGVHGPRELWVVLIS
jgi:L-lactate dehydrogenase complex protein LldG